MIQCISSSANLEYLHIRRDVTALMSVYPSVRKQSLISDEELCQMCTKEYIKMDLECLSDKDMQKCVQ